MNQPIATGEVLFHHHRNNVKRQIEELKRQIADEMFNEHYIGSDPDEASFIDYIAKKMERGEIKEDIKMQWNIAQVTDEKGDYKGIMIKWVDDNGQIIKVG